MRCLDDMRLRGRARAPAARDWGIGVRYWWVNQNKTHDQEQAGGYLWSPTANSNGAYNQFYENMKHVTPGDLVFCYWDRSLQAYGIVESPCYEAPRPTEFGEAGRSWAANGHKVNVVFRPIEPPLVPKSHFSAIGPLLPEKYSPLHRSTGAGLQSVYLAELPEPLGLLLLSLAAQGKDAEANQREAAAAPEVSAARAVLEEVAGRRPSGQGFGLSAAQRTAVEVRAMDLARKYYEQERWIVEDVHKTHSYDLVCRRDGQELHVEVKGTTGFGEKILLPKNEVAHAQTQYPNVALFIVHGIELSAQTPPEASGGTVLLLHPWRIDQGQLEPLAFSYVVPKQQN